MELSGLHQWSKSTVRLVAAFATALFLATGVYAQVPGGGKTKTSTQFLEKVADGSVQDFIVVYDDKAIEAKAKALQKETGLPSHDTRIIEDKSARYFQKKREVLSVVGLNEISILKEYSHLPVQFVRVRSKEAFSRLLEHPGVTGVFEDRLERLSLAESLPLIGQPQVAAQGNLGAGTAVAVLDTGVDYRKSAFGSCTSPGVPATCKVAYAHNFAVSDGQLDSNGHGTNVAGIVEGVAPATKIIALAVLNAAGTGMSTDTIDAINWVIANRSTYNIVAMNLSLGSGKFLSPETNGFYNSVVTQARAAGVLTVAAAGNDGYTSALASPGSVTGVVSVGAVYDSAMGTQNWAPPSRCSDTAPFADEVTCFSNSASFLTLLAPGSQILAAGITESGTSQATPHVAGAVAVLRAAFPAETLDQTVARLTHGDMVTDSKNDITKPRLNLQKAMGIATTCTYSISEANRSFNSNSVSASIAVTAGVGCTWTAATGTSSATWIVVTSGSNGSGNGSVAYSVLANPNAASRTGTMTVAGIVYTVNQSGAVGTAANILLNPGFEDGPIAWTESTPNAIPVITAFREPAANNNWYAWLCGYDNCADSIYQDVTIPADAKSAFLQFDYWIATDETTTTNVYDSMTVRVYSPPNASTYHYSTLSNLNATSGWTSSQKYDMTPYKGQTIRLQFSATADASSITSFFVDNVNLTIDGATPDTQAPAVPTALKAVSVSTNSINLTWNASTDNVGVTNYRVYRDSVFIASLGNVLAYRDSSLLSGTRYSYAVSACDIAGNCSAQSSSVVAVTTALSVDSQAPTVPTGLTATAISMSAINLHWTAATDNVGVTNYKIYRNGIFLTMLGSVVSYDDIALTAATSYTYTVSACDATGNCSAQSSAVVATTTAPFQHATPVVFNGPSTVQASGNMVNITISRITNNSVSGHSGSLRIELWALAAPYIGVATAGSLTASIRTSSIVGATDMLAAGQSFSNIVLNIPYTAPAANYANYALILEEYDSTNCTSVDHFCVIDYINYHESSPPTVPLGLTATAVSSSQISLSWAASTDNVGVATYKVYRGGVYIALLGNVTSFTDTGLSAASSYSYTVAACDAVNNCSAQSAPAASTTLALGDTQAPTVPTGLTATAISSSRIDLKWNASSDNVGVTAYKIYSSGNLVATLGNVLSSSRTNTPSSTYAYTVSACDAAGNCSAQSAVATATTPALSDTQLPTVPAGLTAVVVNTNTVNLQWSASTDNVGVTSYKVYRDGTLLATLGSVTSYGDVGLKSALYHYTVSACDAVQNCSPQSASVSVTVSAAQVPVCTLSATPASITVGASSTLTASCIPSATSYVWTGGTCAGNVTGSCVVTPSVTTSYTVRGNNVADNGSSTGATVTVIAPPSITAGSPYDGIYQWDAGYYLSVHQIGGGTLIGTVYWVYTANTEQIGSRQVSETDTFDLLHGQVIGSSATMSGTRFYRACTLGYDFTFNSDASLTVRVNSVANSPGVSVADVNCAARYIPVGSVWTIPRIY